MNWREFKRPLEGFKGFKGSKSPNATPLRPLRPLKPAGANLKNTGTATEAELFDMIRRTVEELDAAGDWTNWRASLPPEQREWFKKAEGRIDTTYGERNREGLVVALTEYREACLQSRNRK